MRRAALALACVPTLAWADTIPLQSPVTAVTVYPQGAQVVRTVRFTVPAGKHDLVLTDLPTSVDPGQLDIRIEGVRAGPMTFRTESVPPRGDVRSPEILAAEARIDAIEAQIAETRDKAAFARAAIDAAEAQIGFLGQIGQSDDMASTGIDALRALGRMIGEEALIARRTAQSAEIEARGIERALKDQEQDLDAARQALAALTQDSPDRAFVSIAVNTDIDAEATLTVIGFAYDADWAPVYDIQLTRGAAASVRIERGAYVRQETGESWQDVDLTLSTVQPTRQIEPSILYPMRRRLVDPQPARPKSDALLGRMIDEPMIEAPVIVESAAASTDFDGYAVTYSYPDPVTVTTGADAVRLKLDTLTTRADLIAHAVPARDDTAFLQARIVNDTQQVLLRSDYTALHVDGTLVGVTAIESIPAGAEAELPFGPIEGLRLKRTLLARNQGDRGILTSSNEQTETALVEIENLTNDTWPVRVIDQVPYSEQEDLVITWSATPKPDETDVDSARGVLGWDLTLAPGEKKAIELSQSLSWPQGKELR